MCFFCGNCGPENLSENDVMEYQRHISDHGLTKKKKKKGRGDKKSSFANTCYWL